MESRHMINCNAPATPPLGPLRRRRAKRKRVWPLRKHRYRLPPETVRLH